MTTNYHTTYEQNRLNENPAIEPFFYDIDKEVAARAYHNTSQFPERAGSLTRADYANQLIKDKQEIIKAIDYARNRGAEIVDDALDSVDSWFEEHRTGLKAKYLSYLHSHSNVASSFICGPANFPVARMQKRSRWADTHYENIGKFRYSSKKRILKLLLPYGDGSAIRTDDPNATDKIDQKLAAMEREKEFMKSINKVFRKFYKKTDTPESGTDKYNQCINALVDAGLSDSAAHKAISPDFMGRCTPFKSYEITNLNASIRRYKERVKDVENTQSVTINDEFPNGETATISDDGKIVIEFGYKPNEDTRSILKSHAFKWSRGRVAWVRKVTANALADYESTIKPMLEKVQS